MDLPIPTTTEPTFNPAQVLNHAPHPCPSPNPNPNPNPLLPLLSLAYHPDYAEEKEGSSRIAIRSTDSESTPESPHRITNLLTHHLKRLKNSYYLAMVKHSYMLAAPGSAPPPPDAAVDSNGTDVSSLSKRKPGRPPKLAAEAQPQARLQDQLQAQIQAQLQAQQQQAQFQTQFQNQPQFIQQQPQYVQLQFQPQMQFQADPLLQNQLQFQPQAYAAPEAQIIRLWGRVRNPAASVTPAAPATALEESTTKRRPGRPLVMLLLDQLWLPLRRGRPRKGSAPSRRGRPRKNVVVSNVGTNAANTPAGGDPSGATPTPKRRGRPPKSSNQGAAGVGVTDVPIAAAFDSEGFPDTVGGVTNGAMPLGKRRGRPPKQYSSAAVATTVKRPRKLGDWVDPKGMTIYLVITCLI
ncbi:hypothetical protein HAX54_013406 [Datura stramonium]|uniref:Uncharacterized protein n=1 Tax=Datura stramonium TaxID=4076 RepID=A0ABS8RY90_DATST|nr:hypothetical protein [Datura stramonium]